MNLPPIEQMSCPGERVVSGLKVNKEDQFPPVLPGWVSSRLRNHDENNNAVGHVKRSSKFIQNKTLAKTLPYRLCIRH